MSKKSNSKKELGSINLLFKKTFALFSKKIYQFIGLYLRALLSLAPFVIVLILMAVVGSMNVILVFLLVVAALFAFYYFMSAYIGGFLLLTESDKTEAKEVLKKATKLFWPFLLVTLLVQSLTFLWMMLFIIPGLIMGLYYSLAPYAYIVEGYKGKRALDRSRELIKGHWWQVFGRYFLLVLLFWLIAAIFSAPSVLMSKAAANSWNGAVGLIMNVAAFFLNFIVIIYSYYIYKDLVKVKGKSKLKDKGESSAKWWVVSLLVLLIPLILTAIIISLTSAREMARDALRINHVERMKTALEIYNEDNGSYPQNISDIGTLEYKGETVFDGMPDYPDPAPDSEHCPQNFEYIYMPAEDMQSYEIYLCLESDYEKMDLDPGYYKTDSGNDYSRVEELPTATE